MRLRASPKLGEYRREAVYSYIPVGANLLIVVLGRTGQLQSHLGELNHFVLSLLKNDCYCKYISVGEYS
jgi:hypothetical protein